MRHMRFLALVVLIVSISVAAYDAMLAMVGKAMPLNRLYDDVARLRIERAHLREVNPADDRVQQDRGAGDEGSARREEVGIRLRSNRSRRGAARAVAPRVCL
jgi:hypothetical protein